MSMDPSNDPSQQSKQLPRNRIVDAMMSQVAQNGWAATDMHSIASVAEIPYGELCRQFDNKTAILLAFSRHIDDAMLAQADVDAQEPVRDRIFEVLMERFELLRDYRTALAAITHDTKSEPQAIPGLWGGASKSMEVVLNAAGANPSMLTKTVQVQGLVALYLNVFRTFLKDDSDELGATMKVLDVELGKVEQWANSMNSLVGAIGNPQQWVDGIDRMQRRAEAAGRKFRRNMNRKSGGVEPYRQANAGAPTGTGGASGDQSSDSDGPIIDASASPVAK